MDWNSKENTFSVLRSCPVFPRPTRSKEARHGIGFIKEGEMKTDSSARLKDIEFNCQHCATPLVANALAAVRKQSCFRCGKWTDVPFVDIRSLQTPASSPDVPKVENDLLKRASERLSTLMGHDSWIREQVVQSSHNLFRSSGTVGTSNEELEDPIEAALNVPPPLYAPASGGSPNFSAR